ncbi:hypothetical protein [Enterococcus aquimarinus]|uniref:MapZ extracellular domain-containing protein n=1 Tax=Enterococcus aquimarinus TaxID=328396 RepID=A0A1L8QQS8_9ENTE|nr:hypothetical protein [Enterococcus aquimarinus]OJG09872.1 hypothetical protein RU93_GL000511 [Enterococcus aquimarinus]
MKNPWLKGVSVFIVALIAIGVNVLGYMRTKESQEAQRIEQAVNTIHSQQKQLESVRLAIEEAYVDETQDLLQPTLTVTQVTTIENQLERLKVSAADFSLNASDLPSNAENLSQEKTELQAQLLLIREKIDVQTSLTNLFTNDTINLEVATNDVVIRQDVTLDEITKIRDAVKDLPGEQWATLMNDYLDYAEAQVSRSNALTKSFDEMLQDGIVTEAATYERYLNAVDSVAQVRNPELKEQFQTQLSQISEQMGY